MSTPIDRLRLMLSYCRPMGSPAEQTFRNRFLRPLGVRPDPHGNLIATIGDRPTVLWSCHTDTVHARAGRQVVDLVRDDRRDLLCLPERSRSNCLGADDTAGIFVMMEMLRYRVPGRYVFHYGEECGGIGSGALVEDRPVWLDEVQYAIALDRKGTTDVITHQGGRTASDEFAQGLAELIGMGYQPSDRGIFTDTQRYADVVPECTNLSVGYEGAHTSGEYLDPEHVLALLDRLCSIDVTTIGATRDPNAVDPDRFAWLDDLDPVRDDRRSVYLDPDFDEIDREYRRHTEDQRSLWDRLGPDVDPETERQDRFARELEQYFREMGRQQAQSRYTKGPKRSH